MDEDIKYNPKARKRFLKRSLPLIKAWTEQVTGRAAVYGLSDEYSLAIMTFNAAVDRFSGKGDFYEFAKLQVRQRLYEYLQDRASRKSVYGKNFY